MGTVFLGAKNAARGAMTVTGSTRYAAPVTTGRGSPRWPCQGHHKGVDEPGQGRLGVGERNLRDDRVTFGRLDRKAGGEEVAFDGDAVGTGVGKRQRQLERVDVGTVVDDESLDVREPVARTLHCRKRLS